MSERWQAMCWILVARIAYGVHLQAVPSTASTLSRELGLSFADIGLLIGLFMLPGIVIAVPAGLLGQRFGDRRVALIGLLLMMLGAIAGSLANGFFMLAAAQIIAGVGALLMGVLTTKMTADWFAGRDLPLGLSVMLNGFPVGMALGQVLFPWLAQTVSWRAAFIASAIGAALGFLALALAYRRHANDRAARGVNALSARLSRGELAAMIVAGIIWATYNGCYMVLAGFTPVYLTSIGLSSHSAGLFASATTMASVLGVLAGGLFTRRLRRPDPLIAGIAILWAALLIAAPFTSPAIMLVIAGFIGGIPAGLISAMPGQVLRPQTRGPGLGVFFTWLYIGFAVTPALGGWMADLLHRPEAPLFTGAALLIAALPLLAVFGMLRRKLVPS
ncbi:MAG: MFS transporter [Alphaproteobacteria bacterium]|nr:MFS transporter [Alphaproteobacteria bacterium]